MGLRTCFKKTQAERRRHPGSKNSLQIHRTACAVPLQMNKSPSFETDSENASIFDDTIVRKQIAVGVRNVWTYIASNSKRVGEHNS
jgi:hypothetical protein